MKIGKNLKMLRAERGWTQLGLANFSDVSLSVVKKAESNKPLSMATVEKLANAFSVPVSFLTSSLRISEAS